MTINPQKQAAKKFVEYWTFNRPGSEKSGGTLTWKVPCRWNDESVTKGDDPYGTFATSATQTMTIDANGNCEVIKHGNSVRREITGQKFLNGVLQQ